MTKLDMQAAIADVIADAAKAGWIVPPSFGPIFEALFIAGMRAASGIADDWCGAVYASIDIELQADELSKP